MSSDLLSVFDIARRLDLHVKTVRGYVRDGRLKAVRIGKQYRIARADLEAFTGQPLPLTERESAKRQRHVEVSSLVQIDAVSPESAAALEASLAAFVHGKAAIEPLRSDCLYDRHLGRLKIMLFGGPAVSSTALKLIAALIEK